MTDKLSRDEKTSLAVMRPLARPSTSSTYALLEKLVPTMDEDVMRGVQSLLRKNHECHIDDKTFALFARFFPQSTLAVFCNVSLTAECDSTLIAIFRPFFST